MQHPRIALAANGYADLYALLDGPGAPVDYIKCPLSPNSRAEVQRAIAYRPVVLHCWGPPGYSATWPTIPEPELLSELSELSGAPFISVHLDPVPERDGDLTPAEMTERVVETVTTLQELTEKEILLENVPWYPTSNRPRWGTDPNWIRETLEASDAFFLLDLAHARVAAWQRGDAIRDYLDALPLDRVREIHVSGPRMADDGLRDRHMSLEDVDLELLKDVLARAPYVDLITHEYAGKRAKTDHYGEDDGPHRLLADLQRLDEVRKAPCHNLDLRSTLPSEAPALADLRAAAMQASLEALGRFDPVRARSMLLNNFDADQTTTAWFEGRRVAFFTLRDEVDHWYLQHFYVDPAFHRQGIGRVMMGRILNRVSRKPKPIRLRALRGSDSNAFYSRFGFQVTVTEEFDSHYERPA